MLGIRSLCAGPLSALPGLMINLIESAESIAAGVLLAGGGWHAVDAADELPQAAPPDHPRHDQRRAEASSPMMPVLRIDTTNVGLRPQLP